MATWKKVVVSGSNISQLNNDANYVASTGGGIVSGSGQIDHDQTLNYDANEHFVQAAITTVGTVTAGNVDAVVSNASATTKGKVELATIAEVTAGTDATRAVTPDSLNDGYLGTTNINTVGTITTGVWQGTAISTTYIANTSGTNTGDEPDASTTVKGIVELATGTEVAGGTDATRAVTPQSLGSFKGSSQITTLGTVTGGSVAGILPSGTVSASAQIDGGSISSNTVGFGGISVALGSEDATPAFNLEDANGYKGDSALVTVGTVTSGDVSGILPTGTVSGSAQIAALGFFDAASDVTMGGDISGTANNATVTKIQNVAITSGEATQIANIGTSLISATEWGYLADMNQKVSTSAAVTFSTVNTGQGATEVHLMNQNVRTTDDVTFNDVTVSGDLTVSGTVTNVNTTDLNVEDSWILLASGSGTSGDAGIVIETTGTTGVGVAMGYDFTSSKRFTLNTVNTANANTNSVPHSHFMGLVVDIDAGQSDVAQVQKNGYIKVDSGDIYIYS